MLLEFAAIVSVIPATASGECCILHQILAYFSQFKQIICCSCNAAALKCTGDPYLAEQTLDHQWA